MTAQSEPVGFNPADYDGHYCAAWDYASIVDMTRRLVRIPTRGGRDDYELAAMLVAQQIPDGVPLEVFRGVHGEPLGVAATLDFGPGPHYVLNAPLDTADTGDPDAWSFDPFAGDIVDGWLRGRGASDSKVAVAIFTHLAARLVHHDLRGKLTVLFDLDEHTGGFGGIKAWLASQGQKPDGVMIGYPGNEKIVIGGRGVWRVRITVYGKSAHSGSSRRDVSAIARAAELHERLVAWVPTWMLADDVPFGLPPKVTVTSISGGAPGSYSVVPDACTLEVDVRLTPMFTAEIAARSVQRAVDEIDTDEPGVRSSIVETVGEPWPAYRLPTDHTLVQALQHGARLAGLNPTPAVAGPSNIGCLLSQHGIPATAGFGVAYRGLHAADEAIDVSTVPAVYASYFEAVRRLLG